MTAYEDICNDKLASDGGLEFHKLLPIVSKPDTRCFDLCLKTYSNIPG